MPEQKAPRFQTAAQVVEYAENDGWMEITDYGEIVNRPEFKALYDAETGHMYAVSKEIYDFVTSRIQTERAGRG